MEGAALETTEGVRHAEKSLSATLRPTLERLGKAERLTLTLAALLPADHVALPWIRVVAAEEFSQLEKDAEPGYPDPWQSVLRRLYSLQLLQATAERTEARMHRLLQEVLKREVTTEDLKSWERRLLQHIKARAEFLWEGWVRHEHRWELGPLAACAWQWMERKTDEGAYLANGAAGPLQSLGKFADAEPLMRRALVIDEASFGPDHPRVARDLNNLAQLLQATNRLSDAEPLYRRALAVDEANFRSDHPNVANDLNNLAQLLQATNRLSDAEPLMRRNLEIFLQFTASTGYEHPYLRAAIANYAVLLREMGRSQAQIRAQLEGIRRRSACK